MIAYGEAKQQVAELRLPKGPGPHPVVIVIHGGCWQTPWAMDDVRSLAAALTAEGLATWSLEYRRVGDPGGGWPGTFEDVARGADHLRSVARAHRLDLGRVVALGHSAGGQLALWLAARHKLPRDSPLWTRLAPRRCGASSRSPASPTCARPRPRRSAATRSRSSWAGRRPIGAGRVRESSPIELLPLGVPQRLVCGALDSLVPNELSRRYQAAARRAGDAVTLEVVDGVGHFELVDPDEHRWPAVRGAVAALLR